MTRRLGFGLILIVTLSLLAVSLPAVGAKGEETANDTAVYGAGVEIAEATSIAAILAEPSAWVGKLVRVEGTVVGVCTKKGCWMELESLDGNRLRVQVEEDVIVFPQEAKGAWAAAQGVVELRELTREQYVNWKSHLAEDQGKTFDAAGIGEGPFQTVQIAGTGAEIGH